MANALRAEITSGAFSIGLAFREEMARTGQMRYAYISIDIKRNTAETWFALVGLGNNISQPMRMLKRNAELSNTNYY